MIKNFLLKIIIGTLCSALIAPPDIQAFKQGSVSPTGSTLAPYTSYRIGPETESPELFSGDLLSNKHFVAAAMSVASFFLHDAGRPEILEKWISHNLSGIYKDWALLFEQDDIRVSSTTVTIPFTLKGKHRQARLSWSRNTFNIQVTEETDPITRETKSNKAAAIPDITPVQVSYSVLSAKDTEIRNEILAARDAGIDRVHLDYLDGRLTPGLKPFDCTWQIKKIADINIPMEVHMMAKNPGAATIEGFISAGLRPERDRVFIHYEGYDNPEAFLTAARLIKARGLGVGLVINPETQIEDIRHVIQSLGTDIDAVLLMAIIPGAGSRPFIKESMAKVGQLKELFESSGLAGKVRISTDGGLNEISLASIIESGTDEVISRTWLLKGGRSLAEKVATIKDLSRRFQEGAVLRHMMSAWGLSDYTYLVDAIAIFCNGNTTFTPEEITETITRMHGVTKVVINDERVIDIIYDDKVVRFHNNNVMPIEYLGLKDRCYYNGITMKIYQGNINNRTAGDYVLGISGSWHDSTVCLIKDGKVIAALEEERMTRIKHDGSLFPVHAIKKLLEYKGITWTDIKHIAFGWNFNLYVDTPHSKNPNDIFFNTMDARYAQARGIKPEDIIRRKSSERNKERFSVKKVQAFLDQMARTYGTSYEPRASFVSHTVSHAASAYYLSGFEDKVLTIALDGYGDVESGSVWVAEKGRMRELTRFTLPHSLGWVYCAITEYLGFKPSADEGQVMGFAPYGEPWNSAEMHRVTALRKIFAEYIKFDTATQKLAADPEYFYYGEMFEGKNRITKKFQDEMAKLGITPYKGSTKDLDPYSPEHRAYANLAYVLQERTQDIIGDIVRYYLRQNGTTRDIEKLALAGGVMLNILANGKLISDGLVYGENIFVQPAAGDSGTALGAALTVSAELYGDNVMTSMDHAFLGPDYSDPEIESALKACGLVKGVDYQEMNDEQIVAEAADKIQKAQPIAWFQGRSELGPRALGARSILLNLNDVQANNTANVIKGRQP
ncbi:MAG: carbamoyltransferase N-terminal domain-containing protein, partial [Candidatus Omnitrophica bacterium]|nr:carbamoyltransferase N-terminal domain-containing protein [Candidatus Omnitrophota bacterium]